jgi:flavin-binding protein dodecin
MRALDDSGPTAKAGNELEIKRLMEDHIYKKIEIVGTSKKSMEDAINNALTRASGSVRNMRWFEVGDVRGKIDEGKVDHWQVTVKIGFTLDD